MSPKNPPESQEFLELQRIWYQKLKKSGFNDIEDTRHPCRPLKIFEAHYFKRLYDPERFAFQSEYYRLCAQFLHTHRFETPTDKKIWKLHSLGIPLRKISLELKKKGIAMNKDTVRASLQKSLKLMKQSFRDDENG